MADPVLNLSRFTKYVPTDMDFGVTYAGGYCGVYIQGNGPEEDGHHVVAVHGTEASHLVRFFTSWAAALALYNSLTYLQSHRDLMGFLPGAPGRDNSNGWPSERRTLTDDFAWPPNDYRHEGGTPVPW